MDNVSVECATCRAETEHAVAMTDNTGGKIVLTARCLACNTEIKLGPLPANVRGRRTLDVIRNALQMTKHRRRIIKS